MALTVSVITPSYGQGSHIAHTIESVLAERLPDLEYLVLDGGSTDETTEVLRRYESSLRWVSETDNGQAQAVNKGLRATSGDVIGWLNSDDIYYRGAISSARQFLESNPQVDVVYGDAQYIGADGSLIERYRTEPWSLKRLEHFCYICQPAVFFRRRVVDRYGLLDERLNYCLDYEYWLRLGMQGAKFAYLRRLQAGSRLHAEAKSVRSRLRTYSETNDMLREKLGTVPDSWIFNYAHVAVEERGFSRDRPLLFASAIVAVSAGAALRWNRRISLSLLRTMAGWARAHTRARLTPK